MGFGKDIPTLTIASTRPASATLDAISSHSKTRPTAIERPGRIAAAWDFVAIALQLALFLLIVHYYEIGSRLHFLPVLCVAIGGFVIHSIVRPRFRLVWFCALSIATVLIVLGWPNGAFVVGIGTGLIAICYVPIPFAVRVLLVVAAGAMLAFWRLDLSRPFWPILGSVFMFRLIVYLHEIRREQRRPSIALTAAYFFPLQNVCFLFFPIVDFKTFRETYRPGAGWRDASGAIVFLLHGLSHLLIYRAIKYYLLPSPHQLSDAAHVAWFLAANYALYLHVSGYFHIITGLFHLFGFELPRTHHNYFLASSFTDIWRRINIPWKEFMAKLFFFPVFFATRGWGTRAAILVAALWVFLATWFLHSYQVFWLSGNFPLSMHDAGLWIAVGVLVAWNIQRELSRAREPRAKPSESARAAFGWALRVVGMFVLVSLFWAGWNSSGFFVIVRSQVTIQWLIDGWWVVAILMALVLVGGLAKLVLDRLMRPDAVSNSRASGWRSVGRVAVLSIVAVLAIPSIAGLFGPRAARRIGEMRRESVTPVEAARAVQGYYEQIAEVPARAGAWLAMLEGQPIVEQPVHFTDLTHPSDDFLELELIPNWSGTLAGSPISINRFGMRDRPDLTQQKPAGVRRIAMVGSSVVMGYGVADDQTFPRLFETGLNSQRKPDEPRYQVLNFGVGKSFAIHRRALLDRKVFSFDPDVIFIVAHQDEYLGPVQHLAKLMANGNPLPYPGLREVVAKVGITSNTPWGEAQARLQPHAREVVLAVYRDLVAECRRRGIPAIWVYVPIPGVVAPAGLESELVQTATASGLTVVTLSDWAEGYAPSAVKLGDTDHHPNALGQRLIARRLLEEISRRPELIQVPRGDR